MEKMTKKDLKEFLDVWVKNDELSEPNEKGERFKPINKYAMHAGMISYGFCLKFFVTEENFNELRVELNNPNAKDKMLLEYHETLVEIELDTYGIHEKYLEETKDIRDMFERLGLNDKN